MRRLWLGAVTRELVLVAAAAALGGLVPAPVRAQGEFPLKYVEAPQDDHLFWWNYVSEIPPYPIAFFAPPRPARPPEIKALPKGLPESAKYFRLPVGRGWAVLDGSSPPRLYVDAKGTGDLSAAAPLVGTASPARHPTAGTAFWFGPVSIPVGEAKDAPPARFWLFRTAEVRDGVRQLAAAPAGYMAGEATLAGQTYRIAVLDLNADGRYRSVFGRRESSAWWRLDAVAVDLDHDGQFSPGVPTVEIMPLGKAVRVKDAYYLVQVAEDGSSIRMEKFEPKMGTLDTGAPAAFLVVLSDTGVHNLGGSDGKWRVPEGRYRGADLRLWKTGADGTRWTLNGLWDFYGSKLGPLQEFEIRAGETQALRIGPPLALKAEPDTEASAQVSRLSKDQGPPDLSRTRILNLVLVGKGGERYSVAVGKGPSVLPPPKVKVLDENGKVLASGNAEYG